MGKITEEDLAMFKERSRTELRSNCDVSRLAWDDVVPALCNEVGALRKAKTEQENMLKRCSAFLGETIQCGVAGEMLYGRHVNVAASDLADDIDDLLKLQPEGSQPPTEGLKFGEAIDACRYKGAKIQRVNWNGEGQFVRFESALVSENGKLRIEEDMEPEDMMNVTMVESECFVFHFVNRKTGETGIQVGWLASQADMAARDWRIVK